VIARGLRDLALVLLGVCAATALGSLLVGLAADIPVARAVSGGYLVVGSLLFVAGALAGLRDPSRLRERELRTMRRVVSGGPANWSEAFQLSAALVGIGFALLLIGILVHPRVTFS
jgi:hypothetical protein